MAASPKVKAARGQSPGRAVAAQPKSKSASTAHTQHDFEFGGPIGTAVTTVALPFVILFLYYACPNKGESSFCLKGVDVGSLAMMPLPAMDALLSMEALGVYCAWFAALVILERILPYTEGKGVRLSTGEPLSYRINGHLTLWIAVFICEHCFPLTYLYDHYVQLAVASIVFSTVLSVYLYVSSFKKGVLLAEGGNTGWLPYDFWMGRELNPRIASFDLKVFCELRPGLIGWLVLNLGMMAKEKELKGANSLAMILVNAFQGLYVWDALYNEEAVLTTMDVTTDGFGFMLCFGDLAWAIFALLGMFGFYVFRAANSQKDSFRRDPAAPAVLHLQSMKTSRGTNLITSGWWGLARKINYTGDWLFGLSWSLFTGFGSILTYFYPIYFAILLVHRAWRDDIMCAAKYGADWQRYKKKVPYVFIPGVI